MRKVLLSFLVGLILIQFIRPEKNDSGDFTKDYTSVMQVPDEVKDIIKTSCYDCHSNKTKYPWYSEIAPVSWFLAHHINEGKEHLNFSEWALYNKDQKGHVINDMEEYLEEQKMPLKSYLWIHNDAKLTQEQYDILLAWVESIKNE